MHGAAAIAAVPRWAERRDATRRARCKSGMTPCEASVVTADVTASRSANGRGGKRATSAGLCVVGVDLQRCGIGQWWWWLSGSAAQHGEWRNPIGLPDRVSPYPGAERSLIRRKAGPDVGQHKRSSLPAASPRLPTSTAVPVANGHSIRCSNGPLAVATA
nr:LOW QUALITY PROTEIN: hypothetical protein L204_03457 [Cryptococcus depauperatus CBS 7855]